MSLKPTTTLVMAFDRNSAARHPHVARLVVELECQQQSSLEFFLAGEVEQPQPRHQQLEGALIRVKFYKVLYVPIGGPAHRCVGLSVAPANNSG